MNWNGFWMYTTSVSDRSTLHPISTKSLQPTTSLQVSASAADAHPSAGQVPGEVQTQPRTQPDASFCSSEREPESPGWDAVTSTTNRNKQKQQTETNRNK
eukprot:1066387-Prorocentrum_minimum.AAC.1